MDGKHFLPTVNNNTVQAERWLQRKTINAMENYDDWISLISQKWPTSL